MAVITSEEQKKKTMLYRSVFHSAQAREVLTDMLLDLGFFESIEPDNKEKMALRNYAAALLYNLGILIDENVSVIVDKMMDIEYNPIERE